MLFEWRDQDARRERAAELLLKSALASPYYWVNRMESIEWSPYYVVNSFVFVAITRF